MKMHRLFGRAMNLKLVPVLSAPSPSAAGPSNPFAQGRLFSQSGDSDPEKKTVRARRRRRTQRTDGEPRKRAEAPRRRRSDDKVEPAPPPRKRPQTPRSQRPPAMPALPSGMSLPGGGRGSILLIAGVLVVACICIGAFLLLGGGPGDSSDVGYDAPAPTSQSFDAPAPTSQSFDAPVSDTPEPFVPPSTLTEGQTWLVMLYQDADDKILEQDIYVDLNEAERIGSSDRVHVVAQIDRYKAGYQGDGNWSSAKRFYVTQDNDLQRVHSQLAADLGEVNMSDGDTLVDFVTWAVDTFPADKHALILSDHGMGWPGGWSNPAPGGAGDPASRLRRGWGTSCT